MTSTALPSTAQHKSRDIPQLARTINTGPTPIRQEEAGRASVPGQMEEIKLGIYDTANSKMEKVKKMNIPDSSTSLQIIKLARVKPPEPEEGEENNIMVMEVSDNDEGTRRSPNNRQNIATEDNEPQSTMRNLLSKEGGDAINYNPAGGVSPGAHEQSGASRLSRLIHESSPPKKNASFASSILASLRRKKKTSTDRVNPGQIDTYEFSRQIYM